MRHLVRRKQGISRIEVAVVGAVAFLLIQLLLPGIGRLREAARKLRCSRNLAAQAKAFDSYHELHGHFPVAATWTTEGMDIRAIYDPNSGMDWWPNITAVPPGTYADTTQANWALHLLPHLSEANLANAFVFERLISSSENAEVRTSQIPVMTCPSDTFNTQPNQFVRLLPEGSESRYSRGNYAINGGTQRDCQIPGSSADPCIDGFYYEFNPESSTFKWWGNGIAGINKHFSRDDVTSGLSRVVAIEEIRAGMHETDPRGVWSLGQIGGSITWSHGINGDAVGPNNPEKNSDDIAGCAKLIANVGHETLVRERMGCCPHCKGNLQATARSMHPGGVNVAMADGSVRFIVDEVHPQVWHLLHSRETPDFVELDPATPNTIVTVDAEAGETATFGSSSDGLVEELVNSIGMRFRQVPAGVFVMGLPDEGNSVAAKPEIAAHEVEIPNGFFLGEFEVTQADYEAVMGVNPSWHTHGGPGADRVRGEDVHDFPVENVCWNDAVEFCQRLSSLGSEAAAGRVYRLPTEAEWEYACRSGESVPYRFSHKRLDEDDSGDNGGHMRDPLPITRVGTYRPNGFGLYDMRGNVHEWTADWFERGYYGHSPRTAPQGPESGWFKLFRGSDWIFAGDTCLLHRYPTEPWRGHRYVGFRVVCAGRQ